MEVVDETEALQRFFEGERPRTGGGDTLASGISRPISPPGLGSPAVFLPLSLTGTLLQAGTSPTRQVPGGYHPPPLELRSPSLLLNSQLPWGCAPFQQLMQGHPQASVIPLQDSGYLADPDPKNSGLDWIEWLTLSQLGHLRVLGHPASVSPQTMVDP
ncbi:hypothetical protein P7K49_021709 [Saguinus oedipus]|uniref:Uncharacterized protein n=1 Tax=Saguinus oedipus TaxID=9490 RepID=A0ABQ9UTG8_SAGOE|nr:hypothetical protein P7K49_021709 [Saguinus oedipus]